jgi:hypothetical protein
MKVARGWTIPGVLQSYVLAMCNLPRIAKEYEGIQDEINTACVHQLSEQEFSPRHFCRLISGDCNLVIDSESLTEQSSSLRKFGIGLCFFGFDSITVRETRVAERHLWKSAVLITVSNDA